MDSKSQKSRDALARFNKEIEPLRGNELLDRKIAFDELPPAEESERNLRRAKEVDERWKTIKSPQLFCMSIRCIPLRCSEREAFG